MYGIFECGWVRELFVVDSAACLPMWVAEPPYVSPACHVLAWKGGKRVRREVGWSGWLVASLAAALFVGSDGRRATCQHREQAKYQGDPR